MDDHRLADAILITCYDSTCDQVVRLSPSTLLASFYYAHCAVEFLVAWPSSNFQVLDTVKDSRSENEKKIELFCPQ
jgi:hypothetical protein